jgi:hypothetical protein
MWGLSWESAPKELKWWWGEGHQNLKNLPDIEDGTAFGKSLIKYWASLQPSWRGPQLSRNVPEAHVWTIFAVPGPNGLFLFLVCISWWIRSLDGSDHKKFFTLLEDITWVLLQSTEKYSTPTFTSTRRGATELKEKGSKSNQALNLKKRASDVELSTHKRRRA